MGAQRHTRAFFHGLIAVVASFIALSHAYRLGGTMYRDDFQIHRWNRAAMDLAWSVSWASGVVKGVVASVAYPPANIVLFLPFTVIDFSAALLIFSLLMIAALYGLIHLSLSESGLLRRHLVVMASTALTVIVYHSFPFQLEQERGNSNTLAGFLCAAGLFSMSRGRTVLAVIFLTAATQVRVYPAILVVFLFSRAGIRPMSVFLAVNVAALFCLGMGHFQQFLNAAGQLANQLTRLNYGHSLSADGFLYGKMAWVEPLKKGLLLHFGSLMVAHLLSPGRRRSAPGVVPFSLAEVGLIGVAFQVMDLLPNTSWDYKLQIQLVPFLLLITRPALDGFPVILYHVLSISAGLAIGFFLAPGWLPKAPGHLILMIVYSVVAVVGIWKSFQSAPPALAYSPSHS